MSTSVHASGSSSQEAPLTLSDPLTRSIGRRDSLGLWGNLGISLLLPVAAAYVVLPGRPLGVTLVVVGAVIGSVLLGLGAAAGAAEGVPAMVLLLGRLDRRLLAALVGGFATMLGLSFDITSCEPFLFLIGAVFVPLVGVFVIAYFVVPRGRWDVSDAAPGRPWLLLPWVAGFVAYQLALPTAFSGTGHGWTDWWTARQQQLGIDPANGWSASLVSLAVAGVLTVLLLLPGALARGRRQPKGRRQARGQTRGRG